jgi:hypothetical protein
LAGQPGGQVALDLAADRVHARAVGGLLAQESVICAVISIILI